MRAIIESKYLVRNRPITSYYSFPVFSEKIEETLIRQFDFLRKQNSEYNLTLTIEGNKRES